MYVSDSSTMTGLVTRPWSPNHLVGRWLGLRVSSLSYGVLWHLCPRPPDTRSLSCNLRQSKNVFRHCYMSPNGVHGTKQRTAGEDDCVCESGAETCSSRTLPCHTGSAAWYLGDMLDLWLGSPTCYVCISTCHSHVIVSKICCHRIKGSSFLWDLANIPVFLCHCENKNDKTWGWRDNSAYEVLVIKPWVLEFNVQNPCENSGMILCACNP